MLIPSTLEELGSRFRCLESKFRSPMRTVLGAAMLLFLPGCAHVYSIGQGSLESHVEYMNRAAKADPQAWGRMKNEADRNLKVSPATAKLQLGLLLTTPNQVQANIDVGERILKEILDDSPTLSPQVRDLVELRLQEVAARRTLREELDSVNAKIDELMSIERSLENERRDSENSLRE